MLSLVFATNNSHKLQEVRQILADVAKVVSLAEIGCHEDVPEKGLTLEANALQKAQFVATKYGVYCFADDTGLEVEALNMRPGVFSARYAGDDKKSEKNIEKLLQELQPYENKKARFRTVIALVSNRGNYLFEGVINGHIIAEKRGSSGFGYDPVFIPEHHTQSFAEMSENKKNAISHRAMAVKKLLQFLQDVDEIK